MSVTTTLPGSTDSSTKGIKLAAEAFWFLSVAFGALLYKAKSRRGYGPLALGTAASVGLSFSKFVMGSDPITYAAVGVLMLAGFWNVWPRPEAACEIALDGTEPSQVES